MCECVHVNEYECIEVDVDVDIGKHFTTSDYSEAITKRPNVELRIQRFMRFKSVAGKKTAETDRMTIFLLFSIRNANNWIRTHTWTRNV